MKVKEKTRSWQEWNIKFNEIKSTRTGFNNRPIDKLLIRLYGKAILLDNTEKYLDMNLNSRWKCKEHIKEEGKRTKDRSSIQAKTNGVQNDYQMWDIRNLRRNGKQYTSISTTIPQEPSWRHYATAFNKVNLRRGRSYQRLLVK